MLFYDRLEGNERFKFMKMVLLIDDLREFRFDSPDIDLIIARTSKEALKILELDTVWDEIWFDHDLGKPEGKLDTTIPVVDYLSERAFNDDPVKVALVYVHTSNPVGGKQIVASLQRYGYNVVRQSPETVFIVND